MFYWLGLPQASLLSGTRREVLAPPGRPSLGPSHHSLSGNHMWCGNITGYTSATQDELAVEAVKWRNISITLGRKSSPDLNNRLGGKLVYGGEGDLIAEPTKDTLSRAAVSTRECTFSDRL
jgi:hypothetical protein